MKCFAFTSILLAGCLCLALAGTAVAQNATASSTCLSAYDYLEDSTLLGAAPLADIAGADFTGTVFIPTNDAIQRVVDLVLAEASKVNDTEITELPASVDLFAVPAVQDILKLHLVPDAIVDPTVLTADQIGADNRLNLTIAETLLSSVKKDSLCPNSTNATSSLTAVVEREGATLNVTIVALGSDASVVNASVRGVCSTSSVVHIIDTVLIPCPLEQSTIMSVAEAVAKAAAAEALNTTSNSTGNGTVTSRSVPPTSSGGSSSNDGLVFSPSAIGTFVAAACALLIVSGNTFNTWLAAGVVSALGLVMVAFV